MSESLDSVNADTHVIPMTGVGTLTVGMARKHLDAIREYVRRKAADQVHYEDAILRAHEFGENPDDIGEAAGIRRTKVYDLIRKAKERQQK